MSTSIERRILAAFDIAEPLSFAELRDMTGATDEQLLVAIDDLRARGLVFHHADTYGRGLDAPSKAKRIAGAVLFFLLISSSVSAQSWDLEFGKRWTHIGIGVYMSAAGADLAVTQHCLGSGRCFEVNPILRGLSDEPITFGAVKMGTHALTSWLLLKHHKDHPKLVRVISWALAGGYTALAIRNARVEARR